MNTTALNLGLFKKFLQAGKHQYYSRTKLEEELSPEEIRAKQIEQDSSSTVDVIIATQDGDWETNVTIETDSGILTVLHAIQEAEDAATIREVIGSSTVQDHHLMRLAFKIAAYKELNPDKELTIEILKKDKTHTHGSDAPTHMPEDVTDRIAGLQDIVDDYIRVSLHIQTVDNTDGLYRCIDPLGESCPCPSICYPDLPELNIFNIPRINDMQKKALLDAKIISIDDIDLEEWEAVFTKSQIRAIEILQDRTQFVDTLKLKEKLGGLKYPLYYLDYETINPAEVPGFTATEPMTFQYSLHVQHGPNDPLQEITHKEFLGSGSGNPEIELLQRLQSDIPDDGGSIIVWSPYEQGCHKRMAKRHPEFAQFLNLLNDRIFDLMDIFKDSSDIVLDHRLKAKKSIKVVAPVYGDDAGEDVSYKELEIQHGAAAMDGWIRMKHAEGATKEEIREQLLEYCKKDTWCMVVILNRLLQLANLRG